MKRILILTLCLALACVFFACEQKPTVDGVVAKMTEATGGAATLEGIDTQVSTWNFTMHVSPPGMPPESAGMSMPMKITYKRPNMFRFDSMGPEGSVVHSMIYDGEQQWNWAMGHTMPASEAQNKESEMMAMTWLDGFHNYKDKGFTLELLANETVDGREFMVLQSTDKNGMVQKFYIDPATYLIERQEGQMTNMEGEFEPMVMTMENYGEYDGIQMAQKVVQYKEDGSKLWTAELTEVEHNAPVEDELFDVEPDEDMMSEEESMSMK